jgi:hypothetical protein
MKERPVSDMLIRAIFYRPDSRTYSLYPGSLFGCKGE